MKTSKALEKIREHLWDGVPGNDGERFLCFAAEKSLSARDAAKCKRIFLTRLRGCGSLGTWLHETHNIHATGNLVKLQATRLAWLDSLIAEYRAVEAHHETRRGKWLRLLSEDVW